MVVLESQVSPLGRHWAGHQGWFRFGLLLVVGFFLTFLLTLHNDYVIFWGYLTQESDSVSVLVSCLWDA